MTATGEDTAAVARAREAIAANPVWYHTIEVAPGVVTPGRMDLRRTAPRVLPERLSGLTALDVGTFDGFWAFELERRGAQVIAADLERIDAAEWSPLRRPALEKRMAEWDVALGRGFAIAADLLGSGVRRIERSIYDLSPDAVGARPEVVFVGALLLHLRDPVRALERVHDTLAPGGRLLCLEPISMRDTIRAPGSALARFEAHSTDFNWWYPNRATLRAWARAAGFEEIRGRGIHRPRAVREMRQWHWAFEARRGS